MLESSQRLTDAKESVVSTNYILAAHLVLLATFYQRQPSLLRKESTLNYLLYDCLFHDD